MRKYFIFKIKKEFFIINKDNPKDLYLNLEKICTLKKEEYYIATFIFDMLLEKINYEKLNNSICKKMMDSDYFTKYLNRYMINNFYKNETSELILKKSYIILETNSIKSSFFKYLKFNKMLACDFENRDYFWIDEIV